MAACFGPRLMCAVASWHWVEHPALGLKKRSAAPRPVDPPEPGLIPRKAPNPGGP
jgi:hypothetical protein